MDKEDLIKQLQRSTLYAECPKCGQEFRLRDSTLFDGLGPFPQQALEIQAKLQAELDARVKKLERNYKLADTATEQGALSSGLGKIMEKVIVAHREFGIPSRDCRPLYEPIDFIAFNGLDEGEVQSIDFIEVKSGKTLRLNEHEKMVKKAVEDSKVDLKVME
jgi:predicted Holliday junction resolvase-like endonuclease